MTPDYFTWAEGRGRRPAPQADTVDLDSYLVLEGDAASESIRRHFDAEQRRQLEAAAGE